MPAITQTIPNFLGGVSRQNDDKKLINQVTECVNGYPDPTYGLLKRPGMEHVNVLKKADGTAFSKTELADAAWFFIDRDNAGSYIGAIKGTNIYVWTKEDGTFCTVNNTGTAYLTGTQQSDYHFRSVQDVTVITNKTVTTAMQATPAAAVKSVGTLKLNSVTDGLDYIVTIQGIATSISAQSHTTFDDMLVYDSSDVNTNHHLVDAIKATIEAQHSASNADFDGVWSLEAYTNSLVIKRNAGTNAVVTDYTAPTGAATAFTIEAKGGLGNAGIEVFQDSVGSSAELSVESFNGHHVKVRNTNSADDDYYLEFEAFNGTRGKGFWKEAKGVDVSPGLDAATMPFQLENVGATTFNFKPIPWTARLVGDTNSNPDPSFIGYKITSTFFYNNRFGVLSEDNIFLGVANDSFNFFVKSALTQVDSDPIDLNVASVRPVVLNDVLPSPQGLLLFSARQQFQVYSASATTMTPKTTVIRSISNYEMSSDISPVDVGTTAAFVNRVPGYSKLFTLQLREIEQSPLVVDISKVVLEWIPDTVDALTVSPQNSVVMLTDTQTSYVYLYRFYNNGEKDLFQAWVKWQLPGTIQAADIIDDDVTVVSQHEDEYTIGKITLDEIPTGDVVATSTSMTGTPCLDMATRPVKPHASVEAVVYDETNDITKIYVPYTPIDAKEAVMYLAVPTADVGTNSAIDSDNGYYASALERTESGTNYRYFEVKGKFTDYADGIIVGYGYDFEVELPKIYYRPESSITDFTATLTISRIKFSVGRTGAVRFKVKADGSNEWKPVEHTTDGDRYSADTNPVKSERQFIVPIHQRNTNFELKVTSDFPYPVSLVSMMWEGNYSPRFYRRA
ncbi:tail tubular protein B [uncultured phage MedDCM-OCT-S04-C650]|nr:tail tubular protein B [uncultured phage MedDCM-OCT-S04-C650]